MKSAFSKAAERARERGEVRLARRIEAERRICFKLVDVLLAEGCAVSVDYGDGDPDCSKSRKRDEIRAALFACDMEALIAYRDGERVGWWSLIYGNDGWDVVSDYWANDFCEAIWNDHLRELSDKICDELFA